jgi:hypothetical protein
VRKYTRFLEERLQSHLDPGAGFVRPEDAPLTPEQLEALRALGYID